jgi:hypothetical protein
VKQLKKERNAARAKRDSFSATLAKAREDAKDAAEVLTQAQADLTTRTTERDSALTLLTQAQQGGIAAVLTLPPDGLWASMPEILRRMPNSTCGYSKTFYSSAGYTSYDFVRSSC